jgi:hypothetical protein
MVDLFWEYLIKGKIMFSKIVEFFSGNKTDDSPITTIGDTIKGKPVVKTGELTVKAAHKQEEKTKKHTKATLGKLTKIQLEEIGRSEFGVELDRRKKKEDLVAELLKEQRQANKKG